MISRRALRRVHLAASLTATAVVASLLAATIGAEVLGTESQVEAVKDWIARALLLLVPALAVAGITGARLAGRSRAPIVRRKLRRMRIVGATGLLVLVPCALTLARLAPSDLAFAIVQVVELLAGGSNLSLLVLNARDGMAMRAKRAR
jgi:hypothetical protein